tara:strand:- start:76 stop:1089 length:1014 start_codon:yes stop_codon:yes gene_type:complete
MKNKNLVIIISHCPTEEKQKVLTNQLNLLKSQNVDILLFSHVTLPQEILSLTDYFLYDKSNPLLHWPEKGQVIWGKILKTSTPCKLTYTNANHGWTVFNQIIKASNFALPLDYEYYSFINYDLRMDLELVKSLNNPTHNNILTSSFIDGIVNEKRMPGLLFNILSKKSLTQLLPLIERKTYSYGLKISHPDSTERGGYDTRNTEEQFDDAEQYWNHLINNFNYEVHPSTTYGTVISSNNRSSPDLLDEKYPFQLFTSYNLNPNSLNEENLEPKLLIYNNFQNESIEIHIDDTKILTTDTFKFITLPQFNKVSLLYKDEYIDLNPILNSFNIKLINIL